MKPGTCPSVVQGLQKRQGESGLPYSSQLRRQGVLVRAGVSTISSTRGHEIRPIGPGMRVGTSGSRRKS